MKKNIDLNVSEASSICHSLILASNHWFKVGNRALANKYLDLYLRFAEFEESFNYEECFSYEK